MKRRPFKPQIEYYDERLKPLDEKICDLIKQRKDLSNNNPGIPTKRLISSWSKKYGFYEDFLDSVFAHFLNDEMYKPVVVPKNFQKNIPILKSFEKNDLFYSVTFYRQYENASIIHLNIDRENSDTVEHSSFELSVDDGKGTEYECRSGGGGGSIGHTSFTFIVSPPLPDDISGVKLVFKEYKDPQLKQPTNFEFVING